MNSQTQREPPKVPCRSEVEGDKISNLPGHIVDKILSHLPLRDAVRSSVLSSKWRYKWVTLPYLVFDNPSVLLSSQDQTLIKSKLVNIIDHVLLLHSGPIQKFMLSHRDLQGVSDIDRWILFLSRRSIREFILEIWKGPRYKLPSSIYLCQNLVHLELFNCVLKLPPVFEGLKSLKSIDLQHITMDQCDFQNLISSCPLLERLTLMNFDGFSNLKIHAPNLLFFDVGGVFENVDLQFTFQLAIVSIGLYTSGGFDSLTFGSPGNLIKFFTHLNGIQRLEVQSYFLKYLAAGKIPSRLPKPCTELRFLSLRINFNDIEEILAALCLLRSSPNLVELEMLARPEELPGIRVTLSVHEIEEKIIKFSLKQLREVKIAGVTCLERELNFIKFVLANSPVLEKMTVKPAAPDGSWEMLRELMRELLSFRRASPRAKIIYLDP